MSDITKDIYNKEERFFKSIKELKEFMLNNYVDFYAFCDNSLLYDKFDKYLKDNYFDIDSMPSEIYDQKYNEWVNSAYDPFEDFPINFENLANNQMVVFDFCFEKLAVIKTKNRFTLYFNDLNDNNV